MARFLSSMLLVLTIGSFFQSCNRKHELNSVNGLTEERIIAIAKEHGVEAWLGPEKADNNAYIFKSEEEVHRYFEGVAELNKSIREANATNKRRFREHNEALTKCVSRKDTLRVYLDFPDVVVLDEMTVQECIDLGLLTKHDRRN